MQVIRASSRYGVASENHTHRKIVEKRKLDEAAGFLRPLVEKTKIILGAGAGHKQKGRRIALDAWNNVNGSMLNLSGHIIEGKKSDFTLILSQYGKKPISFEGVPIVLIPNTKEDRCDRATTPIENLFEETDVRGEYRAHFNDLAQGSYTLKIGDPNLNVYGNERGI